MQDIIIGNFKRFIVGLTLCFIAIFAIMSIKDEVTWIKILVFMPSVLVIAAGGGILAKKTLRFRKNQISIIQGRLWKRVWYLSTDRLEIKVKRASCLYNITATNGKQNFTLAMWMRKRQAEELTETIKQTIEKYKEM